MNTSYPEPPANPIELEVIACSLDDALAAYRGGASRLEVTVCLDQAGLTPPLELVRNIMRTVPLPIRVMLRDRTDFLAGGAKEIEALARKAAEYAALKSDPRVVGSIDGLVTGHTEGGQLDIAALENIIRSAPKLRVTVHRAIEATDDQLETLRALRKISAVDRALVSGGPGQLEERIQRLEKLREAFGPGRTLIAGGNLTLDMLKALRENTGIRAFHLGRAARTPEVHDGRVDAAKVRLAADRLGLPWRRIQ